MIKIGILLNEKNELIGVSSPSLDENNSDYITIEIDENLYHDIMYSDYKYKYDGGKLVRDTERELQIANQKKLNEELAKKELTVDEQNKMQLINIKLLSNQELSDNELDFINNVSEKLFDSGE